MISLAKRIGKFGIIYGAFFVRSFALLLLTPYLTRILSHTSWTAFIATQAYTAWISILLDFGFTLSATRNIAERRRDNSSIGLYLGTIYSSKFILIMLGIATTLAISYFGIFANFKHLTWLSFLGAALQALLPTWYFQAIDRMDIISGLDIFNRFIFVLLCVIFIKNDSDLLILGYANVASILASLGVGLYFLFTREKIPYLNLKNGFENLKDGLSLSVFSLLTSIYGAASVFLYGLFVNPVLVMAYGNADRIIRAVIGIIAPLNQIIMPRIVSNSNTEEQIVTKNKAFILYLVLGISLFILCNICANWILSFFYHRVEYKTLVFFRVISILTILNSVNTAWVYFYFIPQRKDNLVTRIYSAISLLSLLVMAIIVPRFPQAGMMMVAVLPEVLAFLLLLIFINKGESSAKN